MYYNYTRVSARNSGLYLHQNIHCTYKETVINSKLQFDSPISIALVIPETDTSQMIKTS